MQRINDREVKLSMREIVARALLRAYLDQAIPTPQAACDALTDAEEEVKPYRYSDDFIDYLSERTCFRRNGEIMVRPKYRTEDQPPAKRAD